MPRLKSDHQSIERGSHGEDYYCRSGFGKAGDGGAWRAGAEGRIVLRKVLRRDQLLNWSGTLPPCVVAMEPAVVRTIGGVS